MDKDMIYNGKTYISSDFDKLICEITDQIHCHDCGYSDIYYDVFETNDGIFFYRETWYGCSCKGSTESFEYKASDSIEGLLNQIDEPYEVIQHLRSLAENKVWIESTIYHLDQIIKKDIDLDEETMENLCVIKNKIKEILYR